MPPLTDEQKKEIIQHHQRGVAIQNIARAYYQEVSTILDLIGQGHMNNVVFQGDMVDSNEVNPGTEINPPSVQKAHYTKD